MTIPDVPDIPPLPGPAGRPRGRSAVGRRLVARPAEPTGIDVAWAYPHRLLEGLEVDVGSTGAAIDERIFVPLEIPALVIEWRVTGETELALRWECGAGDARCETGEATLLVTGARGADAFHVDPGSPEREIGLAGDGSGRSLRCRARLRAAPGEPARFLAVHDPADVDGLEATLVRLEHLGAEIVRREERDRRLSRDLLRLDLRGGDDGTGSALEEAKGSADAALAGPRDGRLLVAGPGPGDGAPRFRALPALGIGSGLLAAGAFESVREVVATLLGAVEERGIVPETWTPGGEPAGGDAGTAAALLLLGARYVLWSGDVSFGARWREALEAMARKVASAGDGSLRARMALDALAAAVEPLGDDAWTRSLRGDGEAGEGTGAPWPDPPPERGAPAKPGSPDRAPDPMSGAGLLTSFVHGTLGARPDAAYGRLTLAPALPGEWTAADVGNIRLGDARIALRYRREGSRHTFSLEPTAGSLPVNLAFRPSVPGARAVDVRVDGRPAELEARTGGGRTTVEVQVALDHERTVTVAER